MTELRYKAVRPNGLSFNGNPRVGYLTKRGEPRKSIVRPAPSSIPVSSTARQVCAPGLLHVATDPAAALTGGSWPCRLFVADPVGDCVDASESGRIEGYGGLRLVREIPAHRALGPQGEHVAEVIARAGKLDYDETRELAAARSAARSAAGAVAWDAAWAAAWAAAEAAAEAAARDAARSAAGAAAWYTAWAAARDAARSAAEAAARDAAGAAARAAAWDAAGAAARAAAWAAAGAAAGLVVKDLVDEAGPFTPEHYEILTRPWRQVISWTGPGGIL